MASWGMFGTPGEEGERETGGRRGKWGKEVLFPRRVRESTLAEMFRTRGMKMRPVSVSPIFASRSPDFLESPGGGCCLLALLCSYFSNIFFFGLFSLESFLSFHCR
ncbi:unnamed protein product [Ixodes persulcatus]